MKLYSHHKQFLSGENFIVYDIAIFLSIKEGQSDIAFSVKRQAQASACSDLLRAMIIILKIAGPRLLSKLSNNGI